MTATNMSIWEALKRPPAEALKTIAKGRLAGKSDINPMWRYRALTEQFGPCGFGWKFTIDALWTEQAGEEIVVNARVSLYVKHEGEWSEALPGVGGSKVLIQESRGPYANDEACKMAVTDALGTAGKPLGLSADIFFGLWDGSKYVNDGMPATAQAAQASRAFTAKRQQMQREKTQKQAEEIFGEEANIPVEYPAFAELVEAHKGQRGINDLRVVGSLAGKKQWPEKKLLDWIEEQGVDLDNGAKTSDFAKLRFKMELEVQE